MTVFSFWFIGFTDGIQESQFEKLKQDMENQLKNSFSGLIIKMGPVNWGAFRNFTIQFDSTTLDSNDAVNSQVDQALRFVEVLGDIPHQRYRIMPL